MAMLSVYVALLVCEVTLWALSGQGGPRNAALGLKGLYTQDDEIGYRLTPNFVGIHDDGRVPSRYATNSLGHRDDEPRRDACCWSAIPSPSGSCWIRPKPSIADAAGAKDQRPAAEDTDSAE